MKLTFLKYLPVWILIAGLLVSSLISYRQLYNFWAGPVRTEADENNLVAEYIKVRTKPEDKIYSYLYGATFYYLTERDSAATYTSASYLLLDQRENFGFELTGQTIEQLQKNKPKYVIMYRQGFDELYTQNTKMQDFLNQNFTLDKEFTQLQVRRIGF